MVAAQAEEAQPEGGEVMARRVDRREELPPMHPRMLYPLGTIVGGARGEPHILDGDEYEEAIAALEAKNIEWAQGVLKQRIKEHTLAVETRKRLAALRKVAREYLEAQGRADDETRPVAVIDSKVLTETIPGPLARVTAALDTVENEVLSWGVHDFNGKRIEMEWAERWTLDVEKCLTSRQMADILREHKRSGGRVRGYVQERKQREETKTAGKRRRAVLKKMGWTEARAEHMSKNGGRKR